MFLLQLYAYQANAQELPKAEKGVLDLSSWDFETSGTVDLSGKWEFYWEELLYPNDFREGRKKTGFMYVPAGWSSGKHGSPKYSAFGFGTYRLKIKLPKNQDNLMIALPVTIYSAHKMWLNDSLYSISGTVSETQEKEEAAGAVNDMLPINSELFNKTNILTVTIQVSNHLIGGSYQGITKPIRLGKSKEILHSATLETFLNATLIGFIIIMGIYHFFLFFFRRKETSTLIFAILAIIFAIRGLFVNGFLSHFIFDDTFFLFKVAYLSLSVYFALITLFFYTLFPNFCKKMFFKSSSYYFNSAYSCYGSVTGFLFCKARSSLCHFLYSWSFLFATFNVENDKEKRAGRKMGIYRLVTFVFIKS